MCCRDIYITLERLRFAAGELNVPRSAQECLQRTLVDRCWVVTPSEADRPETLKCGTDSFTEAVPMVNLHIHEDVENELLTVRTTTVLIHHSFDESHSTRFCTGEC